MPMKETTRNQKKINPKEGRRKRKREQKVNGTQRIEIARL